MNILKVIEEVEILLRQTDGDVKHGPRLIRKGINDHLVLLSTEGPVGESWTTLKAMVAGTDTYTISSEFLSVDVVQRQIDGIPLTKRTRDYIQNLRSGAAPSASADGDPTEFSIVENTTVSVAGQQSAILDVYPKPRRADTLKALQSVIPTPIGYADDVSDVPLSSPRLRALVFEVAAEIAGDAAPRSWLAVAERLKSAENSRLYDQRSQSEISQYEA